MTIGSILCGGLRVLAAPAVKAAILAALLGPFASVAAPAQAQDQAQDGGPAASLYDPNTLTFWRERYAKSTETILFRGLTPSLSKEDYKTAQEVRLNLPLRGDELMGFHSSGWPAKIVVPTVSLKLLDDLSIAHAWLVTKGFSPDSVVDYLAVLRHKPQADFPGGVYAGPFDGLSVPKDAIKDQAVDRLALRLFNSARAFIVARELGLIIANRGAPSTADLRREIEADAFALSIMGQSGIQPIGVVIYFQAMLDWAPNQRDFQDRKAWEEHVATRLTRPMSGGRLRSMGESLLDLSPLFVRNTTAPEVALRELEEITEALRAMVSRAEDPVLAACIAEKAASLPLEALQPRQPGVPGPLDCADAR